MNGGRHERHLALYAAEPDVARCHRHPLHRRERERVERANRAEDENGGCSGKGHKPVRRAVVELVDHMHTTSSSYHRLHSRG